MTAFLDEEAKNEIDLQSKLTKDIQYRSELMSMLKMSFQHLLDVLRHVGDPKRATRKPYENPDLDLPLLRFTALPSKATPPPPYEEDGIK